jgi:hypothetical protein
MALGFWLLALRFLSANAVDPRFGQGPTAKSQQLFPLTFLTTAEKLDYYPLSMHASRFTFAFSYRYRFTGSGYADGVLTMQ